VLLIANLCLWIYFWIAFVQASYPFRPDPLGHPAGTGYTFWGHSIAVVESGFVYPFFRILFYVEFPSFALALLPPAVLHRLGGSETLAQVVQPLKCRAEPCSLYSARRLTVC
jgi:hypothetical protein